MKRSSPQRLRRASAALLCALVLSFFGPATAAAAAPVPQRAAGPASPSPAAWTGSTDAGPGATVTVLGSTTVSTPGVVGAFDTPVALIVKVDVPQTGVSELFLLQIPAVATTQPSPLLMAFHGYNVTYLDILFNTTFLEETRRRGWFLVAPLQISNAGQAQINYGSVQSQWHVEAVLAYMIQEFAVDLDRLYAVGFSMGGGGAMSYAARHRDREKGAFAAVVNHTGSVDVADVWANEAPLSPERAIIEAIFGGTPAAVPFEYRRSSVIELDGTSQLLQGGDHMALNLVDVPVRTYYAPSDVNTELVNQCLELDVYMQSVGATHLLRPVAANCPGGVSGDHCWQSLPEFQACNWLDQQSLASPPDSASYLVDRDGETWGAFRVDRDVSSTFGRFRYQLLAATNTLIIEQVSNVQTLEVDIAELGLDPSSDLILFSESNEDFRLVLTNASQPVQVRRVSQQAPQNCPPTVGAASWCYQGAELSLSETGSAAVVNWLIDLP